MSDIRKFRLKAKPTREQAKRWLAINYSEYPELLDRDISDDMFHSWRFVRALDGNIYFANCVDTGISEDEFLSLAVAHNAS